MYQHYDIHRATTSDDSEALRRLAQLDSNTPIAGEALIGSMHGKPAAAISLGDGRVTADPFQPTAQLVQALHLRKRSIAAAAQTPDVTRRVRAAIGTVARGRALA
jgi:hypothetical protein